MIFKTVGLIYTWNNHFKGVVTVAKRTIFYIILIIPELIKNVLDIVIV